MESLIKGTQIEVTDAFGEHRLKRVLEIVNGGNYPAAWACSDAEWEAALAEGREPEPEPFPWPLESTGQPTHS